MRPCFGTITPNREREAGEAAKKTSRCDVRLRFPRLKSSRISADRCTRRERGSRRSFPRPRGAGRSATSSRPRPRGGVDPCGGGGRGSCVRPSCSCGLGTRACSSACDCGVCTSASWRSALVLHRSPPGSRGPAARAPYVPQRHAGRIGEPPTVHPSAARARLVDSSKVYPNGARRVKAERPATRRSIGRPEHPSGAAPGPPASACRKVRRGRLTFPHAPRYPSLPPRPGGLGTTPRHDSAGRSRRAKSRTGWASPSAMSARSSAISKQRAIS